VTQQAIANIRKAHLERKARKANTVRVPKLQKEQRIRKMRHAEILRMTEEGMSNEEIAENLRGRGVILKGGALRTIRYRMGLPPDPSGSVKYLRSHCYRQAQRQQREQFENIVSELGIEDVDGWTKSKMDEECFIVARRERAHKLMGDFRPTRPYPAKRKNRAQGSTAGQEHIEPPNGQQATSEESDTPSGPGVAHDPVELSDDETAMESEEDEDCEGSDDDQGPAEDTQPQLSPMGTHIDRCEPSPSQPSSAGAASDPSLQPPLAITDHAFRNPQRSQVVVPYPPGHDTTTISSLQNGVPHPQYGAGANMQERTTCPTGITQGQPAPTQQQHPSAQNYNAATTLPPSSQSSSQGRV
jgi:hypothetical protein